MRNAGYDMRKMPAPRPNQFDKYFRKRASRHPDRNYNGRIADRTDGTLGMAEALHWVLHHADGAALQRRNPTLPPGKLAALLVQAASQFDPDTDTAEDVSDEAERLIDEATAEEDEDEDETNDDAGTDGVTEQSEVSKMSEIGIVEICKSISAGKVEAPSEDTLARIIKKHACATRQANETAEQAFTRVVTDNSDDGIALRAALRAARGF